VNYHCPTCTRKPAVRTKCRLEAELKAKKEAELRAIAKLEKDREERGQADELAGAMNEFFSALYVQDMVAGFDNRVSDSSSPSEFPLASPDSITVTTEFGVVEESGTVTVISASGPSPHHQVFDNDTEDENNVEMTEDLNHELSQLQLAQQHDSSASDDAQIEHMQDVSDDEADAFDVDAEGAYIQEFMDDDAEGLLTPNAAAAA
jgi:hypothetical protein